MVLLARLVITINDNVDIQSIVLLEKFFDKIKIHVGLTVYSEIELKNKWIDVKTKVMLYEKKNYNVNPTLYGEEINEDIKLSEIRKLDTKFLANTLHECRRLEMNAIENDKIVNKKFIKKFALLIKMFLNSNGMFLYGYENIFNGLIKYLRKTKKINEIEKIKCYNLIYSIKYPQMTKEETIIFGNNIIEIISNELKEVKNGKKN